MINNRSPRSREESVKNIPTRTLKVLSSSLRHWGLFFASFAESSVYLKLRQIPVASTVQLTLSKGSGFIAGDRRSKGITQVP